MSAIAHVPSRAWAGAHRALLLVAALTVLAVAVALAVVLSTGDSAVPTSRATAPGPQVVSDTCGWAPLHTPC